MDRFFGIYELTFADVCLSDHYIEFPMDKHVKIGHSGIWQWYQLFVDNSAVKTDCEVHIDMELENTALKTDDFRFLHALDHEIWHRSYRICKNVGAVDLIDDFYHSYDTSDYSCSISSLFKYLQQSKIKKRI